MENSFFFHSKCNGIVCTTNYASVLCTFVRLVTMGLKVSMSVCFSFLPLIRIFNVNLNEVQAQMHFSFQTHGTMWMLCKRKPMVCVDYSFRMFHTAIRSMYMDMHRGKKWKTEQYHLRPFLIHIWMSLDGTRYSKIRSMCTESSSQSTDGFPWIIVEVYNSRCFWLK